jgi:hypothetical protein
MSHSVAIHRPRTTPSGVLIKKIKRTHETKGR